MSKKDEAKVIKTMVGAVGGLFLGRTIGLFLYYRLYGDVRCRGLTERACLDKSGCVPSYLDVEETQYLDCVPDANLMLQRILMMSSICEAVGAVAGGFLAYKYWK